MARIVRLTESDLTRIVKRVINEDMENYKIEARIALYRLGYTPLVLKHLSSKELAKKLRQENKDRFSSHDEWERLADKLDRFDD